MHQTSLAVCRIDGQVHSPHVFSQAFNAADEAFHLLSVEVGGSQLFIRPIDHDNFTLFSLPTG